MRLNTPAWAIETWRREAMGGAPAVGTDWYAVDVDHWNQRAPGRLGFGGVQFGGSFRGGASVQGGLNLNFTQALTAVNTFLRKVADEISAPADRAAWSRSDYERERAEVKKTLAKVAAEREALLEEATSLRRRVADQEVELRVLQRAGGSSMGALPGPVNRLQIDPDTIIETRPGTRSMVVGLGNGVRLVGSLPGHYAQADPRKLTSAIEKAAMGALRRGPGKGGPHWTLRLS